MWHSALAAAGATMQYHLFVGGLGGVITVVVGGIISAIAIRNAKRTAVRPATNAEPAPAARRPAPPVSYGEPAPPTSPARRLHPGPISLSEPPSPQPDENKATPASMFNPDLFSSNDARPDVTLAELAKTPPPVLRPHRSLAEEWRANAAPAPGPDLTHAPIWNRSPFARPAALPDASGETPLVFESAAAVEPPIWRIGSISQRLSFASAPSEMAAPSVESFTTPAPIWPSWLRPSAAAEDAAQRLTPPAGDAGDGGESDPPIWPSFLRQG